MKHTVNQEFHIWILREHTLITSLNTPLNYAIEKYVYQYV